MDWKAVLGLLARCEISATCDWLGNLRVSAKGTVAVVVLGMVALAVLERWN